MPSRPLAVGDVIHGFARGIFGRDHYHCVRVEAVGPDWIVARGGSDSEDHPSFATGRRSLGMAIQTRDEPCDRDDPCPLASKPPLTTAAPRIVVELNGGEDRFTEFVREYVRREGGPLT
ncbi:hypothetical protein ABZ883_14770 [Streptomyces sp. NPDC046977]|uniref:hypothetical protein n=1 Tax=Streptomyces sp. NPDC046977 TaxID=3154703 RepID=UPI0033FAD3E2